MKTQPNGKSFISIFFDCGKYFRFSSVHKSIFALEYVGNGVFVVTLRNVFSLRFTGQVKAKVDKNGDVTASDVSNSFSSMSIIFDKNDAADKTKIGNGSLESELRKAKNENGSLTIDVIDGRQGNF